MIWQPSHRADPKAREIADRHYNRQKPGTPQFVPPGRCCVFYAETDTGKAFWVTSFPFAQYVKHQWAGAWVCSAFRNEGAGIASHMIREAVAATRAYFGDPPPLGMITFIDRKKVKPTMVHSMPTWGYTYKLAGFCEVGETKKWTAGVATAAAGYANGKGGAPMQPILKYPGAKWRIAQWIISAMPPHESYVEPYAGSLAVYLNKRPARLSTINDLDGDVVNFWRMCRTRPDELAKALRLTPYAREEFDTAVRTAPPQDELERARRFAVKCWMAYGASATSTGWRNSTGTKPDGGPDNPKLWQRVPGLVAQAAVRLQEAHIENRPALEVITRFNGTGVLIYADPPYLRDTRTAHRDQYAHEMTDADHAELLTALKAHSGMVLLSGYDCALYRETLTGWELRTLTTTAEGGARRTECLWLNPAVQQRGGAQLKLNGF